MVRSARVLSGSREQTPTAEPARLGPVAPIISVAGRAARAQAHASRFAALYPQLSVQCVAQVIRRRPAVSSTAEVECSTQPAGTPARGACPTAAHTLEILVLDSSVTREQRSPRSMNARTSSDRARAARGGPLEPAATLTGFLPARASPFPGRRRARSRRRSCARGSERIPADGRASVRLPCDHRHELLERSREPRAALAWREVGRWRPIGGAPGIFPREPRAVASDAHVGHVLPCSTVAREPPPAPSGGSVGRSSRGIAHRAHAVERLTMAAPHFPASPRPAAGGGHIPMLAKSVSFSRVSSLGI